ncbi:SGNH/GDSL hydrolase family protein [Paraburkholderia terricola]|uniref:SGNH/GDSL hydrolase family protein n=1 Tax=Paraburkholderia terricola TaxID=169427 RepID=UPI003ECE7E3F
MAITARMRALTTVSIICLGIAITSDCRAVDPVLSIIEKDQRALLSMPEITQQIVGGARKAGASSAFNLVEKLQKQDSSVCILFDSDSTGAGFGRWPQKLGVWLSRQYPQFKVAYHVWDDADKVYRTQVIAPGVNGYAIDLYNAGIPGSQPQDLFGRDFERAYGPCNADLIFINHGHNNDQHAAIEVHRGMLLAVANSLAMRHPSAGIVIVAQHPLRDSDGGTARSLGAISAALAMNYGLVDEYDLFEMNGKPPEWYHDDVHQSEQGELQILRLVKQLFEVPREPMFARHPTLAERSDNVLKNGSFTEGPRGADGWETGNTILSRASVPDGTGQPALSIVSTGGGVGAAIYQRIPESRLRSLRGKWVTLAVREWISPGNKDQNAGAIALVSETSTRSYGIRRGGRGGYRWLAVNRYIERGAPALQVRIYSTLGNEPGVQVFVDRAVLVEGDLPYDMHGPRTTEIGGKVPTAR